jgi:hypothetical protein
MLRNSNIFALQSNQKQKLSLSLYIILKIMKQFLLLLLFVAICYSTLVAQTVDPRLYSVFSEEYLEDITVNNPNELKYLNWYLDNSYRIIEVGAEKCSSMQPLLSYDPITKTIGEEVSSFDEENFNVYMYNVEIQYAKNTYYRIGNTGFAIEFESLKKLTEKYNNYNNEN